MPTPSSSLVSTRSPHSPFPFLLPNSLPPFLRNLQHPQRRILPSSTLHSRLEIDRHRRVQHHPQVEGFRVDSVVSFHLLRASFFQLRRASFGSFFPSSFADFAFFLHLLLWVLIDLSPILSAPPPLDPTTGRVVVPEVEKSFVYPSLLPCPPSRSDLLSLLILSTVSSRSTGCTPSFLLLCFFVSRANQPSPFPFLSHNFFDLALFDSRCFFLPPFLSLPLAKLTSSPSPPLPKSSPNNQQRKARRSNPSSVRSSFSSRWFGSALVCVLFLVLADIYATTTHAHELSLAPKGLSFSPIPSLLSPSSLLLLSLFLPRLSLPPRPLPLSSSFPPSVSTPPWQHLPFTFFPSPFEDRTRWLT